MLTEQQIQSSFRKLFQAGEEMTPELLELAWQEAAEAEGKPMTLAERLKAQHGEDAEEDDAGDGEAQETPKKPRGGSSASSSRIDEYITKISSYKAGGDGGKCLKILKAYVGNVADNPDESKFQSINMENKAFKAKVKPFVGAKQLLQAVGFSAGEPGTLVLHEDFDRELFKETKAKLEAALAAYG